MYSTEVEKVLYACPSVRVQSAAVFGQPNDLLGEVAVAAVCLSSDVGVGMKDEAEAERLLIKWCSLNLASFKVPLRVHVIDKMPMTGSGKVRCSKRMR